MAAPRAPAGSFTVLYFAAASSFTKKQYDHMAAPVKVSAFYDMLEERYAGIKDKILSSCALTVNLDYVDVDEDAEATINEGDEVAIIPPSAIVEPLFTNMSGQQQQQQPLDPRLMGPSSNSPGAPYRHNSAPMPYPMPSQQGHGQTRVYTEHKHSEAQSHGHGQSQSQSQSQSHGHNHNPNPNHNHHNPQSNHGQQSHPYFSMPRDRSPSDGVGNVEQDRRTSGADASAGAGQGNSFDSARYALMAAAAAQHATPDSNANANGNVHTSADHTPLTTAGSPLDGQDQNDAKRARACEACRGLKVRCDQDPAQPDQACKRCAKAGRQCIITQPSRRRQKKSDTRVAELEKKIDALTAVLQAQQQTSSSSPVGQASAWSHSLNPSGDVYPRHLPPATTATTAMAMDPARSPQHAPRQQSLSTSSGQAGSTYHPIYPPPGPAAPSESETRGIKRRRTDDSPLQHAAPAATSTRQQSPKIVQDKEALNLMAGRFNLLHRELHVLWPQKLKKRIDDMADAPLRTKMFRYYCDVLSPQMPMVVFPPGTTADDVFETRPILMLCIMAVASPSISDDLRETVNDVVFDVFAEAIVRKGIKALEIVQGIQVIIMWARPAERPQSANFYALLHMAVVMALDLGLGRRFNANKAKRGFGGPGSDLPPGPPHLLVDSDSIEARRAFLGCYYLAASVAQVFRRPNVLRWTSYMAQCIEVLDNSPDAAPSDRLLTQFIRVQHICEEINTSFALDDPEQTSISIVDPKVAYTLDVLEKSLDDWKSAIPADLAKPELFFFYEVTSLYLHEIALHVNHNTDDFRVPFTEATLKSGSEQGYSAALTHKQMAAIEACLTATHRLLDIFCNFSPEQLTALPAMLYFIRVIYALIVLIKMHVAVTSPASELGKVIKKEDLRVREYLDRIWGVMQAMNEYQKLTSGNKALFILGILRDWVTSHQHGDQTNDRGAAQQTGGKREGHVHPSAREGGASDSLRVLSEAATQAGGDTSAAQQQQQPSTDWAFNSPSTMPYLSHGLARTATNASSSTQQAPESTASNTLPPTPGSLPNSGWGLVGVGNGFPGALDLGKDADATNLDWTAGLDFESAVNVALQDLDFSGDMFGSFFGNGADAFQIPPEGVNMASGLGGANNAGSGRW